MPAQRWAVTVHPALATGSTRKQVEGRCPISASPLLKKGVRGWDVLLVPRFLLHGREAKRRCCVQKGNTMKRTLSALIVGLVLALSLAGIAYAERRVVVNGVRMTGAQIHLAGRS